MLLVRSILNVCDEGAVCSDGEVRRTFWRQHYELPSKISAIWLRCLCGQTHYDYHESGVCSLDPKPQRGYCAMFVYLVRGGV